MQSSSKCDKLKSLIAPKMTYLVTFFGDNVKLAIYTGENIRGIDSYLVMIGFPTNLTYLGQISHNFGT